MNVLLKARVGSHAYGLAREGSDEDFLGIFVEPTVNVLGLHDQSDRTVVTKDPDTTMHEVGKYMRLALKCNPTILELMFIPDEDLLETSGWGKTIRGISSAFLSKKAVRNAYWGYAAQQHDRMARRNSEEYGAADSPAKKAKHARHCVRLIEQGTQLLARGSMSVKVSDPEFYFAFDDMPFSEFSGIYMGKLAELEKAYATSALPDLPNSAMVNDLLVSIRKSQL